MAIARVHEGLKRIGMRSSRQWTQPKTAFFYRNHALVIYFTKTLRAVIVIDC